jgi:hypothetical protein
MNLLKTPVVSPDYDVFWNDIGPLIETATEKPILILIDEYQKDSAEAQQLQKMLDVSKLTPEQYNIIMLKEGQKPAWHQLRDRLNPTIVFLVGIMPARLGISVMFRLNEPNRFDERSWLPTLTLAELERHPDAKKQLWGSGMKPLFVDNPIA